MTFPPEDTVRIVPAAKDDLAAIAELASTVWRACYPGIITHAQIDYMLPRMYGPDTLRAELRQGVCFERLFVGVEFVGFASYGPAEKVGVFKLHKLYVHPAWHGRGLGSGLVAHCEREVRKLGARRLILTVNKRNVKAIASYRRNGFCVADSVVTDIGGGFVMDDYVMAKELVAPEPSGLQSAK